MHAAIVGGGIAGMAAALGLVRAGWRVDLFEKAPVLRETGAGLQLSPNACKVLQWLGVMPQITACAFVPQAATLRDGRHGGIIYRAPLGDSAQKRWGAPYLHVHRADLLGVLTKAAHAAGVRLGTGQEITQAITQDNKKVLLHQADGTTHRADLVIAADGIRSQLQAAMPAPNTPRFRGQIAWRALVPTAALPADIIAPEATVWAGAGRHLVTYYLRGGSLINLVAVLDQQDWQAEGWSLPGEPTTLQAAFAGWHPAVERLLGAVDRCFIWGLFARPLPPRWYHERMVLIGDAAHPIAPFMAQGAAMALEDVAILCTCLERTPEITAALGRYQTLRQARLRRVLKRSDANGVLFHKSTALGQATARLPLQLISTAAPALAMRALDWLYGYDAPTAACID